MGGGGRLKIYLGYAKTYRDKIYPKQPWTQHHAKTCDTALTYGGSKLGGCVDLFPLPITNLVAMKRQLQIVVSLLAAFPKPQLRVTSA